MALYVSRITADYEHVQAATVSVRPFNSPGLTLIRIYPGSEITAFSSSLPQRGALSAKSMGTT